MNRGDKPTGPLQGIRVLDFTALLQGPLATQILGDLGADVVKVEKPEGEWMRNWGICATKTHGEFDAFLAFNRNKLSIAPNLKDECEFERLLQLVDKADVVVENFRPGAMDRMGLGWEELRKRNPRLIYAASSGYGQDGPYVKKPGQDYLIQALTGAMWMTGRRDDPPFVLGVAAIDQFTGLHLATGILSALVCRERTGVGQRVDVDLMACAMAFQQQELTVHFNQDIDLVRPEANIGHPGLTAPSGVYQTEDGHLLLAMCPCPVLGEILGLDWLAQFDTNERMAEAREEIYERLANHFATETTQRWLDLLSPHDIWCAPVQQHKDLRSDPQVAHRKLITKVPFGDGSREYETVGTPFSFSEFPPNLHRPTPETGQHDAEFRAGTIWQDG